MRNAWRVGVFDIAAPLAAVAALLMIGYALDWRVWWVAVCSVVCTLIVEGAVVNFVLFRRDGVTLGTDDDGPGLRLAVVGLSTAALVAAVLVTYTQWTRPDRELTGSLAEVVQLATRVSEATGTFSPQDPTSSIDKAAALMGPEQADAYKDAFAKTASELAAKNVSAEAHTISAGVEALGPDAASVAVVMRAIQTKPNTPPEKAVLALRVTLTKTNGKWLVFDVTPATPTSDQHQGDQHGGGS
jgi:hypothetical protein